MLGGTSDTNVNLDLDNSSNGTSVRFRIGYIGANVTRFSNPINSLNFADWDGNNNLITIYQNTILQGPTLTLGAKGSGGTPATGATVAINGIIGTPTNLAGGNLTLQAGPGTGNATAGDIIFNTADVGASGTTLQPISTKAALKANGNLGIGIAVPSQKLVVGASSTEYFQVRTTNAAVGWNAADATLYVGKDATTSRSINAAGSVNASGADYAEYFAATSGEALVPGEVACVAGAGQVKRCPTQGSAQAVGVVSTQPAFVGNDTGSFASNTVPVLIGLAGQVPVKVSSENGSVQVGDYLTLSATAPGRAMKATNPGWVIGKVLAVNGQIIMLIQTSYYVPSVATILQNNPPQDLIDLNMTNASAFDKLVVTDTLYVGAKLIVNGTVQAKQLCLDDVCIDKDQLRALLNLLGTSANTTTSTPTGSESNDSPPPSESSTPTDTSDNTTATASPPADSPAIDSASPDSPAAAQ